MNFQNSIGELLMPSANRSKAAWIAASQPGTKVYRANRYDGVGDDIAVREGVIMRVELGTFSSGGYFTENPKGDSARVVAKFERATGGNNLSGGDWYSQTSNDHEFCMSYDDALCQLIRYLDGQAADKERDAQKLRVRANHLTTQRAAKP